jgi:hypothetical protein
MAVGTTAMTAYQNEDCIWDFTVSDPNVADIAGWTIGFKIKALASDPDPALVSATASITGALTCRVTFNMDLAPGSYVYGLRRTDTGFSWELATASVTVLDTPSVDTA